MKQPKNPFAKKKNPFAKKMAMDVMPGGKGKTGRGKKARGEGSH